MHARTLRHVCLLLLISLILISCGTAPVVPPQAGPADFSAEASAAIASGDRAGAAQSLEDAAARAQAPERQRLLLLAAGLRLDLQQSSEATDLMIRASGLELPLELQYHYRLLQTRLSLATGRSQLAAEQLQALAQPPQALRAEWLKARAEILSADGQALVAAQARVELDPLLIAADARAANRQALWSLLNESPMDALRARMPPPPDEFGGWLELAFLVRTHRLNLAELQTAVDLWEQRYPEHPAAEVLLPELLTRYRENLRAPQQIAVLLPLSGDLAGPARAILDGFTAAYYASGTRPQLRIYDTGATGNDVFTAYQTAVDAGAEFVVGPLTKESLIALATGSNLPVPVLALNTLPGEQASPSGLYQFALAPEDEAAAAASYALARGQQAAVVLVPQGDWGLRVQQAFRQTFEQNGGVVLEVAEYDAQGTDFTDPIREVLNLDASERRYRELRAALRRDIQYEPYRRRDTDVVFIGATSREARLIRPQLRFFHAIDLPVLATSHAYGGAPNDADQDLDGLQFVDMPWLLHPGSDSMLSRATLQETQLTAQQFPRLYAFGLDAFRLIPYLQVLGSVPGESVDGATGVLSLDESGRIHRRLFTARFDNGRVSTEGLPQHAFGPQDQEVEPDAW